MRKEDLDLLDKYAAGTLSREEQELFEEIMNGDPAFREEAEVHRLFLQTWKKYDERKSIKNSLETFHKELQPVALVKKRKENSRSIWPVIAVAASVALITVIGTLFTVKWYDNQHQVNYQELRKNVERLKRSQSQIIKDIESNSKKDDISPGTYSGSGFMISPNGYVVTSYHVIKAADSVYIENEKLGRFRTKVMYTNPVSDIALLMVTDENFKLDHSIPFTIASEQAEIGESVYALGFPREEIVYGEGSISAATGYEQNINAYQISIPVNPGNSGGPMMDAHGALIGIVNGIQTETRGTAYAVKSTALLDAIKEIPVDSLPRPLKLTRTNQLANLSRVNQIKQWREYVFVVKVYQERK